VEYTSQSAAEESVSHLVLDNVTLNCTADEVTFSDCNLFWFEVKLINPVSNANHIFISPTTTRS
jgi:hypothetical protein